MRKLEITVQDQGKWKSLCRVRENGNHCAGSGKLEITVQDQGNWRSLFRTRETGDHCAGPAILIRGIFNRMFKDIWWDVMVWIKLAERQWKMRVRGEVRLNTANNLTVL